MDRPNETWEAYLERLLRERASAPPDSGISTMVYGGPGVDAPPGYTGNPDIGSGNYRGGYWDADGNWHEDVTVPGGSAGGDGSGGGGGGVSLLPLLPAATNTLENVLAKHPG